MFSLSVLTPLGDAITPLYVAAVLLTARFGHPGDAPLVGLGCLLLAAIAFAASAEDGVTLKSALYFAASGVAITGAAVLARSQQVRGRTDGNSPAEASLHGGPALPRASEERYRTIFDAAGVAIWEADWSEAFAIAQSAIAEGETDIRAWFEARPDLLKRLAGTARISDANLTAVKLFGAESRADLLSGGLGRYRTTGTLSSLPITFSAILGGASVAEVETKFRNASGDIIDVVLRVTLPPDHDGWRRALVMAMDVTEWHRDQARLRQAQTELAHASRITILGQLATSIAHEVNQPLAAIITYAKSGRRWLAQEAPDAVEVADCLDHVVTNGTRSALIIERIRTLARNGQPKFEPLDLAALVRESSDLLRLEIERAGVRIDMRISNDLPPIVGDRVQIQQVVMNVSLNALQALARVPIASRELVIEIGVDGPFVTLCFEDTGPGFGDIETEQLFRPFVTTKADGMGIGLSICRAILEHHGGTISIGNRGYSGARVAIWLPTDRLPSDAPQYTRKSDVEH